MTTPLKLECEVHFERRRKGARKAVEGAVPAPTCEKGRVPRLAKLMALAIRFEGLIRDGVVKDYAELARLGRVSRARLSQIMNLTLLAPDIQEEILFMPRVEKGKDVLSVKGLQSIALTVDWKRQRRMWGEYDHDLK